MMGPHAGPRPYHGWLLGLHALHAAARIALSTLFQHDPASHEHLQAPTGRWQNASSVVEVVLHLPIKHGCNVMLPC